MSTRIDEHLVEALDVLPSLEPTFPHRTLIDVTVRREGRLHGLCRVEAEPVRAGERRLAHLVRFLDAGFVPVEWQCTVVEDDVVGAGVEHRTHDLARVLQGMWLADRVERHLESGLIKLRADPDYSGICARPEDLAMEYRVAVRNGGFLVSADIDALRDSVNEHRLAEVPAVGRLRVPQAGKNELAGSADDPRPDRNRGLPLPRYRGDL